MFFGELRAHAQAGQRRVAGNGMALWGRWKWGKRRSLIRHKAIGSGVEDSVSREMKLDLNGRRKLIHHSIIPPVGLCSLGAIRRPAAIDAADETLEARIGLLPRAVCALLYVLYCMFAGVWYPVPHMEVQSSFGYLQWDKNKARERQTAAMQGC